MMFRLCDPCFAWLEEQIAAASAEGGKYELTIEQLEWLHPSLVVGRNDHGEQVFGFKDDLN